MFRGLIFDLDGTLVDSLPGIATALNQALEEAGLPTHSETAVAGFIGDGMENLVRRALGGSLDGQAAPILERLKVHYGEAWKSGTRPYPGITDFLESLSQDGYRLAVLSNKPHPFTVEIVEGLFPAHLFDPVRGHWPGTPRKPDPTSARDIVSGWGLRPSEVAYVGDSTVDLATAEAAGLTPFIFSWGYGTPENVPLVDSLAGLAKDLERQG